MDSDDANERLDPEVEVVLKQVEATFIKFSLVINDPGWIPPCSMEDVKTAFKMASSVEKAADIIHHRFDYLRQFLQNIQRTHVEVSLCMRVYFKAGDTLLAVFFRCPGLKSEKLDLAIRMYLGLFGNGRLKNCIANEFTSTCTELAIIDFLESSIPPVDTVNLKSTLFLKELAEKYPSHSADVKQHIKDLASNYKIASGSLEILLRVVGLKVSGDENVVRNLIIDLLLERMYDRSVLSKPFWIALFKELDDETVTQACRNCSSFLDALCSFIIYIGGMMEKLIQNQRITWHGIPNVSICPEITYHDLLKMCKLLSRNEEYRNVLHSKVVEAHHHSGSSIWLVIEEDLEVVLFKFS